MIWHQAPSQQPIAFAVEVQEGILHQRRDVGVSQPALSETVIEFTIYSQRGLRIRLESLDNVTR